MEEKKSTNDDLKEESPVPHTSIEQGNRTRLVVGLTLLAAILALLFVAAIPTRSFVVVRDSDEYFMSPHRQRPSLPVEVQQSQTSLTPTQPDYGVLHLSSMKTVYASPDTFVLVSSINITDKKLETAYSQVKDLSNKLAVALKENGIEDKDVTGNITIYPQYENIISIEPGTTNQTSKSVLVGYTVSEALEIKSTDMGNMGKIIDVLMNNGINSISGIRFELSDSKKDELKSIAVKQAMDDVYKQADLITAGSKTTVVEVRDMNVSYGQQDAPMFRNYADGASMAKDATTLSIPSGESSYSVTVDISFYIKQVVGK